MNFEKSDCQLLKVDDFADMKKAPDCTSIASRGKTLHDARNDYIEKETDLIRESASSPKEFLDIKLSRDLFGEAEAATPDEYRAYCDASNKVFVGASGLHPNDYFKQLGVSVRF